MFWDTFIYKENKQISDIKFYITDRVEQRECEEEEVITLSTSMEAHAFMSTYAVPYYTIKIKLCL